MLKRLGAGQGDHTQGNCQLIQKPANFRNAVSPLRVIPKLSRTLTRSVDRNMIACVALASQELTRNAPPIVVRDRSLSHAQLQILLCVRANTLTSITYA